jgi:hypothetical protein
MGYCDPVWISDYTYSALFQRIQAVNGAKIVYPSAFVDRLWERAKLDAHGNLVPWPSIQLHNPPGGLETPVTVTTAGGTTALPGHFVSFDHLPGGLLFWPAGSSPATGVEATLGGQVRRLTQ